RALAHAGREAARGARPSLCAARRPVHERGRAPDRRARGRASARAARRAPLPPRRVGPRWRGCPRGVLVLHGALRSEIGGVTLADELREQVLSGTAWDRFCDALKDVGKLVQDPRAPADSLDRAEGYRFLSPLVRHRVAAVLEDRASL